MGQISSVGNAERLGLPAELPARPRRWYLVSMGSFDATLLAALLSAGVSPERAREVVEQLDRAIDERVGLHAQVLATKRDVAELQVAITERIAGSNERIAGTNARIAETNERIAGLDLRLSARIAELDTRLSARLAATNERIAETKVDLVRWMLGALTAQTALILGATKLL